MILVRLIHTMARSPRHSICRNSDGRIAFASASVKPFRFRVFSVRVGRVLFLITRIVAGLAWHRNSPALIARQPQTAEQETKRAADYYVSNYKDPRP